MRRSLLLFLSFFTSATAAFSAAVTSPRQDTSAIVQSPRIDTVLNSGWRFMQGDDSDASKSDYTEGTNWQSVTIPHNWGWQEAMAGRPYYRGPGWYRCNFTLGQQNNTAGPRRYFLRFEAASTVADVYLNGKHLGQHRGGFGAFCFEVTSQISSTGANVLAVRVSNAADQDVAPLSGDFSIYGGLYRPVHLLTTDTICFTPTDHASPGVAWYQTSVTPEKAVIDIVAQISNPTRSTNLSTLTARVLDADGHTVATESRPETLIARQTAPFTLRLTVPNPHLWNGRKDPYLYQAVVELDSADGVDLVTQPLGLRFERVDPDKGFFLNGQPYHLHGVDKHQDREGKGWAVSEADLDEDLSLIKEMGCTVVRCAHYQHSDYWYSLCDKAGILVWAEIPQVDRIATTPEFAETSRNQLLDLIRQNVNHPSIFAWSLFNELRDGSPDPHRLLQDLKVVANGEDPTRPTIAATCTANLPQMNKIPDLLGWNIYPGWYGGWGSVHDFGPFLDAHRYDSRSGGYCVSEYGAGANIHQHEQNPAQPQAGGQWHPEEWQDIVHEEAWRQMKTRPFIWGTFVWNMFDFAVSSRHEGGVAGRNDKGLVTYDRQTKKDAFYFYKANWSDEPVLYLTSRRFTERTNPVTDVKIYSNATDAELLVNGASQGTRSNDGNAVFTWPDIHLKPGDNRIEARATRNGQPLTDSCVWTLKSN
jgi:beta-galactosidase